MDQTATERATILIVDDVPGNIDILGGILADEYTVKVATNGRKALQLAESVQPALILLDIMMPEMNGYEVCRCLKQNPATRDIPVIFVTALSDSGDEEKGFAVGAVDYLTKPINPPVALARAKIHLALRQAHLELERWNSSLQARVLQDYKRQKAQLRLYEMDQASCNDLLDAALEEVLPLTNSSIGYIYQYDEGSRLFTLYAWSSSVMPECRIMHKQTIYELDKTGLWGEAVRQRKPIITNDYAALNPYKKGCPEGHVPLIRHLNLPIFRHQKIVAVVGVGNKPTEYDDDDVRQLELFLNSTWNSVERRKAQDELEVARKVAEESSRMKSELLANLSHELRTPLNGIIGGAQLLQFTELTGEQKEYLQMIDESSANELNLVNNLLELVRMESEGVQVERAAFSLRRCIDDAVEMYEGVARSKGLVIYQDLPCDLPQDVVGDKVRILQILHCLMGNAVKFTEQGSVTIRLTCQADETGRLLICVSVVDTGIGIEPDKLDRIFEQFVQLDMSNTRRFGGLGLGLAICGRLAKNLGGSIRVESVPGSGSSFHLELPLDPVSAVSAQQVLQQRCLTILLAEDDQVSSKTTGMLLGKLGHRVITVKNGKEAVERWQRLQPDLVLMDIQMPVMTGLEALQQIRILEREHGRARTPVVAQTAFARWDYQETFSSNQFDGFVAKPLKKDELEAAITGCCGYQDVSDHVRNLVKVMEG